MNGNHPRRKPDTTDGDVILRSAPVGALEFPEVEAAFTRAIHSPIRQIRTQNTVPDIRGQSVSDDDLMRQFQAGDEHAFVELYKRRRAAIFTFCLRMCGDADIAKDAFQETFIRIHDRSNQYRGENFRAWSRSIARSVSIDLLRKRTPVRFEEKHYAIPSSDPADFPDYALEQELVRSQINSALARIPIKLREPFVLHEYEEMKISEIAIELKISEDAVRQRVWRARQRLRELLLPSYKS